MLRFVFSLALAFSAAIATADECRDCKCDRCGCQSHCHKVCRVVCEMKEVKETHYCCKCEDFCVPGKSCKCGEVCEPDNFDCPCDNCAKHCKWFDCLFCKHERHRTIWSPSCDSEMYTRTKLIKYQVPKKVPTYKWVVEYCCDHCECTATQTESPKPPPETKTSTPTPKDRAVVPSKAPVRPKAPIEASFEVRATDIPDPMPPVLVPGHLGLERMPHSTTSEISWQRPE